ncbi:MAG: peptide-methionine (S)-S-oxide reductase, partial [Planctomycetota bacterium]
MAELPPEPAVKLGVADGPQAAVFAGGCFWCVEGVFEILPGVSDVTSGYAGGDAATANYEATCRGDTGHAEVVRVTYDPAEVSFETLLQVF